MKNMLHGNSDMKARHFGKWSRLLMFITVLFVTACSSDGDSNDPANSPTPARGELVSASIEYGIGSTTLDLYLGVLKTLFGLDAGIKREYDVTFFKIIYTTIDTNGNIVNASGLVSYPIKNGADPASPLLSMQHGTIGSDDDAPSNIAAKPEELGVLNALFSSQGYVVAMPDYLGYGESTQLMHPYIIAETSASATIDLLRAVRNHAAQIFHTLDGQLFITGYSEGGYVTLAAQKEMETNLSTEFAITKSIPAAGPYNISWTAKHIVDLITLPSDELLAFIMKSYDTIYGYNRISEIFQSPYDAEVNSGYFYGDVPSITLTDVTADLLTPVFLYGPDGMAGGDNLGYRDMGELILKSAFATNDLHMGWTPVTPTILFHGADDQIVPYQNALDAVSGLGMNVSLNVCTEVPADHLNCAISYVKLVLDEFGWPY